MEQTLVLNASFEPLRIVPWQKAVTLLFQEKVEVMEVYDRHVRSISLSLPLPAVLRLRRHVRPRRAFAPVPFTRANVYARDEQRCQYCGQRFSVAELTFDHVLPVARGGHKDWDNIVTCCVRCNRLKGDQAPEEVGLTLIRRPRRPDARALLSSGLSQACAPPSWRGYLAWGLVAAES